LVSHISFARCAAGIACDAFGNILVEADCDELGNMLVGKSDGL
jgi:hypothetical protein